MRIIGLAILIRPLITASNFTCVGPIGYRVKIGDIIVHRLIEYLRVYLAITLKLVSFIVYLGQVDLLLLIQNLNVLLSFITDRRMSVNILIASSSEEGLRVNFRLAVI